MTNTDSISVEDSY